MSEKNTQAQPKRTRAPCVKRSKKVMGIENDLALIHAKFAYLIKHVKNGDDVRDEFQITEAEPDLWALSHIAMKYANIELPAKCVVPKRGTHSCLKYNSHLSSTAVKNIAEVNKFFNDRRKEDDSEEGSSKPTKFLQTGNNGGFKVQRLNSKSINKFKRQYSKSRQEIEARASSQSQQVPKAKKLQKPEQVEEPAPKKKLKKPKQVEEPAPKEKLKKPKQKEPKQKEPEQKEPEQEEPEQEEPEQEEPALQETEVVVPMSVKKAKKNLREVEETLQ